MRYLKLLLCMIAAAALCAVTVAAGKPTYDVGEVVYHQDFADVSLVPATGITKGTAGTDGAVFTVENGQFAIDTYDNGRVYAILPPSERTPSFTMEVTFAFDKDSADNGYLGIMLTCSGKEPGNISQVIFRAKGAVDDFGAVSDGLAADIRAGKPVHVVIPVENGVVQKLTITAGEHTEELQRESIMVIGGGNKGFSARNAGVNIGEIYIVNGVDYTEKTGRYATESYANETTDKTTEIAPATGDIEAAWALAVAVTSMAGAARIYAKK